YSNGSRFNNDLARFPLVGVPDAYDSRQPTSAPESHLDKLPLRYLHNLPSCGRNVSRTGIRANLKGLTLILLIFQFVCGLLEELQWLERGNRGARYPP